MRAALRPILDLLRRTKARLWRRLGWLPGDWKEGLPVEARFWADALRDPDQHWFRGEYEFRMRPDSPFQEELRALAPASGPVRVLDVGAGPLTTLGKSWPGRELEIVAVDPLAAEYDRILAGLNLQPPRRTVVGEAERLGEKFAAAEFDLAYSSNALDHCRDPLAAIRQMLHVVKPGGVVYLWHFANEGLAERYHGLHQWNFDVRGGDFLVGDGHRVHSLRRVLGPAASLSCEETQAFGKRVVVAILRKASA